MKRRALEHEYGEPLYDICHGFAEMGYSRHDTARILGYSESHFTRHVLPEIDPGRTIPWPSRGTGNAVRDGLERRRENWGWRLALSEAMRLRHALAALEKAA